MRMPYGAWPVGGVALALALAFSEGCGVEGDTPLPEESALGPAQQSSAVDHDLSPPLRQIPPAPRFKRPAHPALPLPRPPRAPQAADPVLQRVVPFELAPATILSFDGVGEGFTGPSGSYVVNVAPPDTNGDVGPNHYVHIVNTDLAIFDKAGAVLLGPLPVNTLWSGFGGNCQNDNDGDPIVLYDPIANRWLISQFAVNHPSPNYLQCVAISQTPDPTGAWYRYSFAYSAFNDYPKFGVWPDGYYVTFNLFNPGFIGSEVCAYDRTAMLSGQAATQQCFTLGSQFGGLLPADLDGTRLPPTGAPNYVLALGAGQNQLAFWKFHVDWGTPSHSTFTGPTTIATAAFSEACGGGTCISQSGTSQLLDSLGDRLMYRLAYRNFGDHESLVVNHSVTAGSGVGARWYELRLPGGVPSIYQQGTYAPDSNFRWMGSVAMDRSGNMALGFSLSGAGLHPEVHYTGRLAGDTLGIMSQGEGTLINGAGAQTSGLDRWGDYSMMAVDPADDCTFWYTSEYIPANGSFNWKTRIGAFRFPGCGVTSEFSISASPPSATVAQGGAANFVVSTVITGGSAQAVNLSLSGLPSGATATFVPTTISSGSSSALSVSTGTAAAGTYPLTITGSGTSATHFTSVSLTITPSSGSTLVNGGFETGNLNGWSGYRYASVNRASHTGSYSVLVGSGSPTSGDSSIAQTFTVPDSGGKLSFWYRVHCPDTVTHDWATASLRDNTNSAVVTLLPRTCVRNGAWTQVTYDLGAIAGHSVTLFLVSHDDNHQHDATYTLFDDVAILSSPTTPVRNPGFENGSLPPWTGTGTTAMTASSHSGRWAAQAGSSAPTNGDSSVAQTFILPAGSVALSFFYDVHCPDSLAYDWATATLLDNATSQTITALDKVCSNSAGWRQARVDVRAMAGHSVTLTLTSHDDNYRGDGTFTVFDDISVSSTATNPVQNHGFETGNLTGWTLTGALGVSRVAHSGNFSALLGSAVRTNGDSRIAQRFTVPSSGGTLSFWYNMHCPDSVAHDWATATLRDNVTNATTTVLPRVCAPGGWQDVSTDISASAGHSVTLTLTSHDDNHANDGTYTLFDDILVE